jgi:Dna[CI] antecedent DciA-like protein
MGQRRRKSRGPVALEDLVAGWAEGPGGPAPKPGGGSFAAGPPPVDEVAWRRVVGLGVALRSRPLRIARGTLWVRVASSSWAQELSLLQATIIDRLAAYGVRVEKVRFQVGEVGPPARAPRVEAPPPAAPKAELPEGLARALAEVGDPELRATLAEAAAINLAWQEGLVTSRKRAVRGPRFAEAKTARRARTPPSDSADLPRNRAGRRD